MVECGLDAAYVFFMPMTLDQIVEETRQLPVDVVAELVDRILLARHGGIERRIEADWKTEIDRRIAEIDAGKVQGIPVEESLARLRKSLASERVASSRGRRRVRRGRALLRGNRFRLGDTLLP